MSVMSGIECFLINASPLKMRFFSPTARYW